MKKIFSFLIIFLIVASLLPSKGVAVSNSLTIGSVKVDKVNVYSSAKLSSQILTVLNKGEEYPIITSVAGDSTSSITHTVVAGNTLWIIANQYGTTVSEIQKVNKLKTTHITVGQKLKIPQKYTTHTVVSGDTLWKISRKYSVIVNDLTKVNSLRTTKLTIGKKIKIPIYYYQVQLLGGKKGWIKKSLVQASTKDRIIMGWNYNGTTESYIQQLQNKKNLEVVSPRWFSLNSSENVVTVSANAKYVQAAHASGKQVWPLLGNKFDPVLTDSIISNPQNRQKLVLTLRDSLIQSNSDGINVDFENIDIKNKQDFVLFISELKTALKPSGIVVSVDVTRTNNDPFWSGSFDRKELGKIADYIIMMGYDEYWSGGTQSGSVATLPWVEEGIQLLMSDVPSHKIILGVPFFTREWVTNLSTNKVKSIDRTMTEVNQIIAANGLQEVWDEKASQNYVEFIANGEKHQIWVEDKQSLELRLNIVKQNHLAGAAAWYIGSETPDIWDIFHFNQ
ncbi:LysM peptidoglycan-binding domain-containing protein [Niallia sp. 01092]|uniref:LysM peptidoglycan-binding domain-containing protein n=1 Tax=unclassified Niallia TaxID=2837522 RepID=UPI003FD54482